MESAGLPADEGWRRLSTKMLLIHPVHEIIQYLPALFGVYVADRASDNMPPWIQWVAFAIPIALGIIRWMTTWYRFSDEQLQLRTGLVQRRTLTAPLDRVRSVDVTAPLLHRLLGVARVKIGTGADSSFELNGLGADAAASLRADLLHRRELTRPDRGSGPSGAAALPVPGPPPTGPRYDIRPPEGPRYELRPPEGPRYDLPAPVEVPSAGEGPAGVGDTAPPGEVELARLDPAWVRFAPFTVSGFVAALAAFGFLSQFINRQLAESFESGPLGTVIAGQIEAGAAFMVLAEALILIVMVLVVFSIATYVAAYWGFRLTRHSGGTLHVQRGLLTSRATSMEERRLRGVTITESPLLRMVRGAKTSAKMTGLGFIEGEQDLRQASDVLLPPAPRTDAVRVAGVVLGDVRPVLTELVPHGPAARRRRHLRALAAGAAVLAIAVGAVWRWPLATWLLVPAALPLLLAPLLAEERYRALGHALTPGHLVARSGVFPRTREMLVLDGIIGFTLTSTFFQRRAGLVTLRATTAAGLAVAIYDIPTDAAVDLVRRIHPEYVAPFLKSTTGTTSATAIARTG